MGRWAEWEAIEAAQARVDEERRTHRPAPKQTTAEAIEASEAALDALEESSPAIDAPRPPDTSWQAETASRARATVDPVATLRLWARDWLERHG